MRLIHQIFTVLIIGILVGVESKSRLTAEEFGLDDPDLPPRREHPTRAHKHHALSPGDEFDPQEILTGKDPNSLDSLLATLDKSHQAVEHIRTQQEGSDEDSDAFFVKDGKPAKLVHKSDANAQPKPTHTAADHPHPHVTPIHTPQTTPQLKQVAQQRSYPMASQPWPQAQQPPVPRGMDPNDPIYPGAYPFSPEDPSVMLPSEQAQMLGDSPQIGADGSFTNLAGPTAYPELDASAQPFPSYPAAYDSTPTFPAATPQGFDPSGTAQDSGFSAGYSYHPSDVHTAQFNPLAQSFRQKLTYPVNDVITNRDMEYSKRQRAFSHPEPVLPELPPVPLAIPTF